MLKHRLIPTLLYKDYGLVKGVAFDSWRRIGSAVQSVKVYNMREVDELIFLDITATQQGRQPDFELVDDLADECFMPLTVGGGIGDTGDVERLLAVGADKVALNTALVEKPKLVTEIANRFGTQCAVASIDARSKGSSQYEAVIRSGTQPTGIDPSVLAKTAEDLGAGEILITSVDRDGTMKGYDTVLTERVASAVSIPVIASGGAGTYEHMFEVFSTTGATAASAASMFHFTEQTPNEAKEYLAGRGIPVRN
jgi:imidazole glycerol-phosphate synthase subunit HisF